MIFGLSSEGNTATNCTVANQLGIHLVRSYDLNTSDSTASIESMVLDAANKQVKLILQYNDDTVGDGGVGPDMPIGNLVAHIARVGPTGTMWNAGQSGAGLGAWAPTHIEVGNEWAFSYRFDGGSQTTNGQKVANTVKRFYDAVGPTLGPNAMKFLVEGDDGGSGTDTFMNAMFTQQSTMATMIDGWVLHNYGPFGGGDEGGACGSPGTQHAMLTRLKSRLDARGLTTSKIWITENGISSNQRSGATQTLSNNYGWACAKSYNQAATDMLSLVRYHGNTVSMHSQIYCFLWFQGYDQWDPSHTDGSFPSGNSREWYFGIYRDDHVTAKGNMVSAALTLVGEFPSGSASQGITGTGIASAQAFGTAVIGGGVVTITGVGGISSAQAFGTATIHYTGTLLPGGLSSAEAFGIPEVGGGVHPPDYSRPINRGSLVSVIGSGLVQV